MQPIFLTIVQGDFGFDWNFTLSDSQGTVVNLTGATLTFKTQLASDFAVKSSGSMSITNAGAGMCKYTVQQNDFLVPGTYSAQILIEYSIGEMFTFSDIIIQVEPSLPQPE